MAVSVREANLNQDQPILTSLAQNYLAASGGEKRFRWLYRENPFGPARAWIAQGKNELAIGMAAIFPRRMYCDGGVVGGGVLGDLCVSPDYRSLGPALQLQRACLECARSDDFAMAYDFPSTAMAGVYRHLGVEAAGESVRWVKALRAESFAKGLRVPVPRPLAAAVNATLALRDRRSSRTSGVDFRLQEEACTEEYSELARGVGSSLGPCTVRSAEYLNWRYRRHPLVAYEFMTARRGKQLLAYCVFTQSAESATVVELFGGGEDEGVLAGLVREVAALLRGRGVASLNLPMLASDKRNALLRKLGFWAREAVPVVLLGQMAGPSGQHIVLMHGDRES